ncbi:endolytic transglycosylase MltG [Gelidibacter salicanalis]|uniref:Endolytic murein transglycosylase n=1 Tax=Gelidibacter salicanalis TaxID=291193 RepID=A0A5C7AFV3_9FLAO|nr:endolytic transglycosylase MltG [Gelidibacter salicanalis]TXE07646.1 endolytic transglycosylase MltG [Gelidibacter salicanalis]
MYFKKIFIAIALIGLVIAGIIAYNIYQTMFISNTAFTNEEAYVYIPTNATYQDVRAQLQPLLKDMDKFEALAERKKYPANIKAGKFAIKKGMNNNDIVNSIRSNNIPVKLSFNNQESLERLAGRISTQIEADSLELYTVMSSPEFLKANDFSEQTALGMYIPNSYEFFWNTSAEQFRERMLKEYHRFWNETRMAKAKTIGLTPEKVMTMASIVQKETAKVDERKRVAGVYMNRLKIGMPLQADPTVIYAIKHTSGDFDQVIKRVLYKDLVLDSPYNTYKYAGLPPGLITMPDITSIDAVLNFEKHDYLYFVADVTNFGYHKFAKTLAQHNVNRQEYVRWINQQGVNR